MQRRQFLAMLACTVSGLPGQAWAQENRQEDRQAPGALMVPAFSPSPGRRSSWRVEVEGSQTRAGLGEPFNVRGATAIQHLTVLGRTPSGFSTLWEFEPASTAPQGDLPSVLTDLYGISQLAIGTDFSGAPQQVFGRDAFRQLANEKLAAVDPRERENVRFLQDILDATRENPFFDMQTLAPAATLMARAQRAAGWQAIVGESAVSRQSDDAWGAAATGDVTVRVESIDTAARMVVVTWDWDIPATSLSASVQREIVETLAKNEQMAAALPLPLRADATSSLHRFSGRATISADNGATLSVEEKRTLRIGAESTITVLRATRLAG